MSTKYAILIDTTFCTGCNTCFYKCVQENRLHEEGAMGLMRTHVICNENDEGPYHYRCMHCEKPKCVDVCQAEPKALSKSPYGAVLYDEKKCIGCQACVEECPFGVPQFNKKTDKIVKCSMCAHRTGQGIPPVCVDVCITDAMKFGEFDKIAAEAKARAAKEKLYLYGDKEAGGTSLFILTRKNPAAVGYPKV